MKLPYSIPTIAGCLALTLAPSAAAQTPATASAAASIVLSPFEVIANTGGYAATTTQVATGFNRDVQRTPLAVNILTEEFIREAGFNSYQEMSDFIPSAYV